MARIKNTTQLRDMLLDVISDVRKDKVSAGTASSISALAGRVLESVRLDLRVAQMGSEVDKKRLSFAGDIGTKKQGA